MSNPITRRREVLRLLRLTPEEIAGEDSLRLLLAREATTDLRCLRLHARVETERMRRDGDGALRAARLRHRRPAQALRRVASACENWNTQQLIELVEPAGGWLGDFATWFRHHLARLSTERTVELFAVVAERSCILQSGDREALTALRALLPFHRTWRRPPADWRPRASRPARQAVELVRHLLAEYRVPGFLDQAWLLGQKEGQRWYQHLTLGGSIRSAPNLPFAVSKRTVKFFLHAPSGLDARSAMRFAQARALGAGKNQALAIAGTRLGRVFEREDFWLEVIRWLMRNPGLEFRYYGVVTEWIHHQRHVVAEGERHPPQRRLEMRRRSPERVVEQALAWNVRRNAQLRRQGWVFPIDERRAAWSFTLGRGPTASQHWIVQVRNSSELAREGRLMGHCVATYAESCKRGHSSIWSLRVGHDGGVPLATLEVRGNTLVQARCRFNKAPEPFHWQFIDRWCADRELVQSRWLRLD